ncbi:MAG: type II CAAX endopeptidase family protein [Candidatus Omnitrophota bacterium]
MTKDRFYDKTSAVIIWIFITLQITFGVISGFYGSRLNLSFKNYLLWIFGFWSLFIAPILILFFRQQINFRKLGFEKPKWQHVCLSISTVLLFYLVFFYFDGNLRYPDVFLEKIKLSLLKIYIHPLKPVLFSFFMFFIVVLQEVFWRGLVQNSLTDYLRPYLAIFVASFFFTLMHIANLIRNLTAEFRFFNPYVGFCYLFVFGIVVGWVYYKSKNMWLPVMIHFIYNWIPSYLVYYWIRPW